MDRTDGAGSNGKVEAYPSLDSPLHAKPRGGPEDDYENAPCTRA